jgi:hypothetical protein
MSGFLDEYNSSAIVITESSRGGLGPGILLLTLLLFVVWRRLQYNKFGSITQNSNLDPYLVVTLATLAFVALTFMRGGLGLALSFVFPYLRGFDRLIILITFLTLVALGIVASRGLTGWSGWQKIATIGLILVLIDHASGAREVRADVESRDNGVFTVAGQDVIERLVFEANRVQEQVGECHFLTIPVTSYPVDFSAGVVSYLTYETIKPALSSNNQVGWTAGSIPGTPDSNTNERYRELFLAKDYSRLISESESNGSCGVVVFGSLQTAMHAATSGLYDSKEEVLIRMAERYPKTCFEDAATGITLMCRAD